MSHSSTLRSLSVLCWFLAAVFGIADVVAAIACFTEFSFAPYLISFFCVFAWCFGVPIVLVMLGVALKAIARGIETSEYTTADQIKKMKQRLEELEKQARN